MATVHNPGASCLNCPSYLTPAESVNFFNRSIGTAVCARYGKPMARMSSSDKEKETLAKEFATKCVSYGVPRPAVANWNEAKFQVMLPDPTVLGRPPHDQDLVNTCQTCENFVRDSAVVSEVGWSSALCAAKGKLLLANRYTFEARNCEDRSLGTPRNTTTGMTFIPEYDDAFMGASDPTRLYMKQKATRIEPELYPTDKPVSPADEKRGIRAWRAITDPETDNTVYLPIYRIDFFDEETQKLIPRSGDDEHPEDYVDHGGYTYKVAVLWTELDETPAFNGRAGTGKTEFFRHMAYLMCLPFRRISITASTELDDIAGKMLFDPTKGTYFHKGRLVDAWSSPGVCVVDEPNAGQPDVWQFIRPMTDNSKQLVVDAGTDKMPIDRDLDCYVGMAMNPAWDPLNTGLQEMGDADSNRLMHFSIELPPPALEREIIEVRCRHDDFFISKEQLDFIMAVAEDIRAMTSLTNQTLPITWGVRPQLKVARALRWFDAKTAYRMAIADFLEPVKQELMMDVVRTHLGESQ
jgi:MoxR-like ATPase